MQLKVPVLWIRDILVRIRIRGSMPLTRPMDPDPAIFVLDRQDANKKIFLFDADADPGYQNDADPWGSGSTTLSETLVK
jgi:hypothetical protein